MKQTRCDLSWWGRGECCVKFVPGNFSFSLVCEIIFSFSLLIISFQSLTQYCRTSGEECLHVM